MVDIQPIKPIKLCVNITIPTIDDDSISLYECVGILGNKLQEAIQKINESLGSLEGVYRPENPPPYPVTSVNQAETKDVITVFEPEGGDIEDVSQAELIAAYKAGARLGAFNQDNGTCRLYHFNLYIDPERVDYTEVAGGGASGVTSVNGRTGAVNIFNAPISAATAESVTALSATTQEQLNQLKSDITDVWKPSVIYRPGDYCIYNNVLYKSKTQNQNSAPPSADWETCTISGELLTTIKALNSIIAYNVKDLDNPPAVALINSGINPIGKPPDFAGNGCFVIQHNSGQGNFCAQLAFGFGNFKLALRTKMNSPNWSSWKYISFV